MRDVELHIDRTMRSSHWLERHLHDELSLERLAYEAGYSLHHFIRVFRAVTGMRPMEFLQKRRLTWAAEALLDTKHPIQWVSAKAGYDSPSSFGRAFRRQYGMSPLGYRERAEKMWFLDVNPLESSRLWHQLGGGVTVESARKTIDPQVFWGLSSIQTYDVRDRQKPLDEFLSKRPMKDQPTWELRWTESEAEIVAGGYHQAYAQELVGQPACEGDQFVLPGGDYAVFDHKGSSDQDYFHSCRYIFQRWLDEMDVAEDRTRPTFIKHVGSESDLLECRRVQIYLPIQD